MKESSVVLEYCVAREGLADKWGFRFTTPAGQTLVESPKAFNSQAEAEEGFMALIKSVATSRVFRLFSEFKPT